MAEVINDIISKTPYGGTAVLPSGEYEGPVYITKPLRLVGNNTTIWAKRGSIIEITAKGCSIENLRVELTEGSVNDTAIKAGYNTLIRGVEVAGAVKGFGAEDGRFDLPRSLELGEFPSEGVSVFNMTVNVPAPVKIECKTPGLSFKPDSLSPGRNKVEIEVSGISPQTFLYSEVLIKSMFTRRMYVSGKAVSNAAPVNGKTVYAAPEAQTPPGSFSADVITVHSPVPIYDIPLLEMKKGQRTSLYQYVGTKCEIRFSCEKPSDMEIDPYAFLLDGNEKSLGEEGLVFFGNESSLNGEVRYFPSDGHVEIDFEKIDYKAQKIALAYSVYAGNVYKSFGRVRAPTVSIFAGGTERISFLMEGLYNETTVVAVEFYLYKGEWKISAVGSGYRDGMAKLCNHYGIEVID